MRYLLPQLITSEGERNATVLIWDNWEIKIFLHLNLREFLSLLHVLILQYLPEFMTWIKNILFKSWKKILTIYVAKKEVQEFFVGDRRERDRALDLYLLLHLSLTEMTERTVTHKYRTQLFRVLFINLLQRSI